MTQYITFLDEEETHSPESLSATTAAIRDNTFTTPSWVDAQETVWASCDADVYCQEVSVPNRDRVDWLGFERRADRQSLESSFDIETVQVDDYIMANLHEAHRIYTRQVHVEHDPIGERMMMRFTLCGDHGDMYAPQLEEYVHHYRDRFIENPLLAI